MLLSKLSDIREVFNAQRWRFNNDKFVKSINKQLRRIMISSDPFEREMAKNLLEDIAEYISNPEEREKKKSKNEIYNLEGVIIIKLDPKERNLLEKASRMLYEHVGRYHKKNRRKMRKTLGVSERTLRNKKDFWDVTDD